MSLKYYSNFIGGVGAAGLFLIRFCMGAAFILHGWPKIQNPLAWMSGMGMSEPGFLQALAALAEFGGGLAIIMGFLTPLAAVGLICNMIAAFILVHLPQGHPFVASQPSQESFELPLIYLATAVGILLLGPGTFSLDALLFERESSVTAETNKRWSEPLHN